MHAIWVAFGGLTVLVGWQEGHRFYVCGTGSPGYSQTIQEGRKTVVCVCACVMHAVCDISCLMGVSLLSSHYSFLG